MIVVLGRPSIDEASDIEGLAGRVALAAAEAGGRVEVVGSIRDDPGGDAAIVELGRAGIGHAALLREPPGADAHLDAGDIDLGLRYVVDCSVLVIADDLDADSMRVAIEAATYHRAWLIVLVAAGAPLPAGVPETATVLEVPAEDPRPFAALVGHYAALIDSGSAPVQAWDDALAATGWQHEGTS